MPGQPVFGHQVAEIPGRVTGQGRLGEMRVLRQEARGLGFEIGEVAAPAARYANLFCWLAGVIDDAHTSAALGCPGAAEQASRASANDEDVNLMQIRSHAANRGEKVLFPPCWRLAEAV